MKVTHLVLRNSQDETTAAIVTAEFHSASKKVFLHSLQNAVTNWVTHTEVGKRVWDETCQDLNIGDLDSYSTETLLPFLSENGINDFDIHILSSDEVDTNWTYDTVLATLDGEE